MITTLRIGGMLSVHSSRAVFTALTAIEGITSAQVEIGTAVIEHDGRATADALREALAAAGYEVLDVKVQPRRLA